MLNNQNGLVRHLIPIHKESMHVNTMRHGLSWTCGNMDMDELEMTLKHVVHMHSDVFVVNPHIHKMLCEWGYCDVVHLKIAPTTIMDKCADNFCGNFHDHSCRSCAQRTCHEILNYLRPVLVPKLDTSVFKYESSNTLIVHEILPPVEPEPLKYGVHQLVEPLYNTLEKLTLDNGGIKNCKLSMAGEDEYDGGLGWSEMQARCLVNSSECEASNQAAGTTYNQIC